MRAQPDYSLTLDALDHFIARCETLGVHFALAGFTGGEPTLWPHLAAGIERMSASPVFGKLRLNTNGANLSVLDTVAHHLTSVRLSVHAGNTDLTAKITAKDRARYKIKLWNRPHRAYAEHPIPNSTPAKCSCPIPIYFDGRMYICPGALISQNDESASVDDDFAAHYISRQATRMNQPFCRQCISNAKAMR